MAVRGLETVVSPAGGTSRRHRSWTTHLALTLAVLIISAPLIFALIKSTQESSV